MPRRLGVVTPERARRADGPRAGGAIIAAKGSFKSTAGVAGAVDAKGVPAIGGGPTGLATSSGSSPGKTQTLRVSSKYAFISSPAWAVVASGFNHLVILVLMPKSKKLPPVETRINMSMELRQEKTRSINHWTMNLLF